ncbi:anthrone oxygenase family protein [Rhodococcus sp. X156]|uniref:anthrone oxygenase family protein n=1 Tax=Rhodococcus sp. X156 TaxID=2499145 RepID=UPI000FDB4444|nr:anthrone oxygenase family protein [Rhodococcus sp. X156]
MSTLGSWLSTPALVVAVVANGLLAGVFFAFSCAISLALHRVDDRSYVTVFRAINSAILNAGFLLVFALAPLAAVAAVALPHDASRNVSVPWLVAGAACSVATFVITAAANVPLNRALDAAPVTSEAQCTDARGHFEGRWNRWNLLRTATGVAAVALLAVAGIGGA